MKQNRTWLLGITVVTVLGIKIMSASGYQPAATLTFYSPNGNIVSPGSTVPIEVYLTADNGGSDQDDFLTIEGGQFDLPCTFFPSSILGTGELVAQSGTCDPQEDESVGPGSTGDPYLFGEIGTCLFSEFPCATFGVPGFGQGPADVPVGATRYLGTVVYQVSNDANGSFQLWFQCTDEPGEMCDSPSESTNSTRYREDFPPGVGQGTLIQLTFVGLTLKIGDLDPYDVAPCVGDGLIDVDDILGTLNAFVGVYGCTAPEADCGILWDCGGGTDIYNTNGGNVGVGTVGPSATLHVQNAELLLTASALENDDLIVESNDAVIGLYSRDDGTWGSALALKELQADGTINNTWGIARQTTGGDGSLNITSGLSDNYATNAIRMKIDLLLGYVSFNRSAAATTHPIHVGTSSTNGNGAHLTATGTWTNGSSREWKEGFESIDKREVLQSVYEKFVDFRSRDPT